MNKDDIQQGLAEVYMYNCHKCGQGNLSRDEVHARDHKMRDDLIENLEMRLPYGKDQEKLRALKLTEEYICLKCLSKEIDKEE